LLKFPNITIPFDELPNKLSATLAADVKKKNGAAKFSKVKNKQGGLRRGIYKLKPRPKVIPIPSDAPSDG
jgi:hypothetical protein